MTDLRGGEAMVRSASKRPREPFRESDDRPEGTSSATRKVIERVRDPR